jgi:hypothetical protein
MDVGYQNQSTALIIGGNNVRINGYEKGTFDGNGDYWYQWIREQPNTSNYPGRPHGVTFDSLTNSVIRGLTFLRSQMWYVGSRILCRKSHGCWGLCLLTVDILFKGLCQSLTLTTCCLTTFLSTTQETGHKAVKIPE